MSVLILFRIPLDPELQVDMLGSVFIDTMDSVRNVLVIMF